MNTAVLLFCAAVAILVPFAVFGDVAIGKPVTRKQIELFKSALELRRKATAIYNGPNGQQRFLKYYADMNMIYCDDLYAFYGQLVTEFMAATFNEHLTIQRELKPVKYDGEKGKGKLFSIWKINREKYCNETGLRRPKEDVPIPPVTIVQKALFNQALKDARDYGALYTGTEGEARFMKEFTTMNNQYCADMKAQPNGEMTEYQEEVWNSNLRQYQKISPDDYKTDEAISNLLEHWRKERSTYCDEAGKKTKTQTESVLVLTMHSLLKRRAPGAKTTEYIDHTSIKVIEEGKYTVGQLADEATKLRRKGMEKLQKENPTTIYSYPTNKDEVQILYAEGKDKAIFARALTKTGSDADIRKCTQVTGHVHIYDYKPDNKRIQVTKNTSRLIYAIVPGTENGKTVLKAGSFIFPSGSSTTAESIIRSGFKPIARSLGTTRYDNNKEVKLVYLQNGSLIYKKGEAQAQLRTKLAKTPFKDQDPLLLFNFNPLKKLKV